VGSRFTYGETFRCEEPIDPDTVRILGRGQRAFDEYLHALKRSIAFKLADHLMERCVPLTQNDLMSGRRKLFIEIVINDRGAHERDLDFARSVAEKEERERVTKRLVASLPYGLAEAAQEFYE